MMIKLYAPAKAWGILSASPFCMKLELYLIFNDIKYEKVTDFSFARAPRGKVPYISDREKIITDSTLIIEYLNSKNNLDMDKHLTSEQKSISHFILRTLEDSLYWTMFSERWSIDDNWKITKDTFFGDMPKPLSWIIPNIVRKSVLRNMKGQGVGRRERSELQEIAINDIDAILQYVGGKKFIFGDVLSFVDIAAYSTLANLLNMPHESKIKDYIKQKKETMVYINSVASVFGL